MMSFTKAHVISIEKASKVVRNKQPLSTFSRRAPARYCNKLFKFTKKSIWASRKKRPIRENFKILKPSARFSNRPSKITKFSSKNESDFSRVDPGISKFYFFLANLFFRNAQMLFSTKLKSLRWYLVGALREMTESGCLFQTLFEAFSYELSWTSSHVEVKPLLPPVSNVAHQTYFGHRSMSFPASLVQLGSVTRGTF